MVGWLVVPSWPISIGSPITLLATSTAMAPASCALRILAENVHPPREINAILPTRLAGAKAAQALLRPLIVPGTTARGAVKSDSTVANSPASAATVLGPAVTGVARKCGTVLAPAAKAREADTGDSIARRFGPPFPADTATT